MPFPVIRDTFTDLQTNVLNTLTHFLGLLTRFLELPTHFLDILTGLDLMDILIIWSRKCANLFRKLVRRSRKCVRRSRKCVRGLRIFVWRSVNVALVTGNGSSAMEMYQ